ILTGVNVGRFGIRSGFRSGPVFKRVGHSAGGLPFGGFQRFLVATGLVISHTRTGRNQTADNDVLLQTTQLVALAHDGSLGEHAGGFLEGSRRDEGVGRQRSLGDAQQHVLVRGRNTAFGDHAIVFVQQLGALHLFTGDEVGVTRVNDVHATQHLTDDHFNVLVVDLHALQTVNVLHFVDDVGGQLLDTLETQDVVRIRRTVDNHFALVHHLAVVDQHLLFLGNQELVADAFQVGDDQTLLALGVLAEGNRTRDFSQHAGILGRTGFEQLGHTRQTPGNVAGLLRLLRNTRQNLTHLHVLTVTHRDQRAHREGNVHGVIGTGDLHFFASFVDELDLRAHHGLAATRLGRDDDQRRQTRDFVHLAGHGHALFDVLEADTALVFGHDRAGERIPRRQTLAGLHGFTVTHRDSGTVRDLVTFALAAGVVVNDDFAGTGNGHALALGVGHITQTDLEAHRTGGLGFHGAGHGCAGRRTPDVKGTHRQLRARLTDRLSGNHTDGFTAVDHGATAQIAAVAVGAQTVTRFAGERRANLDFINAEFVDEIDIFFGQQRTCGNGCFLRVRVDHVDSRHTTENPVAQRFDHFTAFNQRLQGVTLGGAAIVLGDDQVLGDV